MGERAREGFALLARLLPDDNRNSDSVHELQRHRALRDLHDVVQVDGAVKAQCVGLVWLGAWLGCSLLLQGANGQTDTTAMERAEARGGEGIVSVNE